MGRRWNTGLPFSRKDLSETGNLSISLLNLGLIRLFLGSEGLKLRLQVSNGFFGANSFGIQCLLELGVFFLEFLNRTVLAFQTIPIRIVLGDELFEEEFDGPAVLVHAFEDTGTHLALADGRTASRGFGEQGLKSRFESALRSGGRIGNNELKKVGRSKSRAARGAIRARTKVLIGAFCYKTESSGDEHGTQVKQNQR